MNSFAKTVASKLKNLKNNLRVLLWILVLGTALRFIHLDQSLWLDEAAQAIESVGPFSGLFKIYADFMPPFFHILLYFWMQFSHSEVWMRLLPVTFGIVTIYLTYLISEELFSWPLSIWASFLLSISPFHIYYSQELRPYALATLLATASSYFLLKRYYLIYTASSILLVYTFYPAAFLLLAHGFYIIVYERSSIKRFILSITVTVLSFIPWLPVLLRQLRGGYSLTQNLPGWEKAVSMPPVKALGLFVVKFLLGKVTIDNKVFYGIVFLILTTIVLYMVWSSWQSKKKQTVVLLIFILVPVASMFIISFILPVIAPQRLIFILPFFLILLSSGLLAIKPKPRLILTIILLTANFYGLIQYNTNPRFQREQWRQATAFVEEKANDKIEVLFAFPEPFAPFQWYSGKHKNLGIGVASNFTVNNRDLANLQAKLRDKNTVYLFGYLAELTDPNNNIPKFLTSHGYNLFTTSDYHGVGFVYEYGK